MKARMFWLLTVAAFVACFALTGEAGIVYDEASNSIHVQEFPEDMPCTLQKLAKLDPQYGWGKVTYDKASDTYTMAANLIVGFNDGATTFFQIGTKENPTETLVMKGNLIVHPKTISGQKVKMRGNPSAAKIRLTIGDPNDASIKPTVKFDCTAERKYTVYVNVMPVEGGKFKPGAGGDLRVYNATITAVTQKKGGEFGAAGGHVGMAFYGNNVLCNATISWWTGHLLYAAGGGTTIQGTVFENGGHVTYDARYLLTGCTFRNLSTGIFDAGGINTTITDCVFEGNDRNLSIPYTSKSVTAVDCTFGKAKYPDAISVWTRGDKSNYPSFISRRHVIIEVVDEAGKPVKGAAVEVTCDQGEAGAVSNGKQPTGADGRTPGKGEKNAILLTEHLKKAVVKAPAKVTEYTYSIKAGPQAAVAVTGYKPAESWKVVRVVLKK